MFADRLETLLFFLSLPEGETGCWGRPSLTRCISATGAVSSHAGVKCTQAGRTLRPHRHTLRPCRYNLRPRRCKLCPRRRKLRPRRRKLRPRRCKLRPRRCKLRPCRYNLHLITSVLRFCRVSCSRSGHNYLPAELNSKKS